jgi:hypothetical protein
MKIIDFLTPFLDKCPYFKYKNHIELPLNEPHGFSLLDDFQKTTSGGVPRAPKIY